MMPEEEKKAFQNYIYFLDLLGHRLFFNISELRIFLGHFKTLFIFWTHWNIDNISRSQNSEYFFLIWEEL